MHFAIMADIWAINRVKMTDSTVKEISLEPIFINVTTDISPLNPFRDAEVAPAELRHAIGEVPFNTAYDFFRSMALEYVEAGKVDEAIERIKAADALIERMGEEEGLLLDVHAALMQIMVALYIYAGNYDEAMLTAATVLNLLASEPKRKDEPFLSVLASLLYDIALLHNRRGEYKQAEREIEKSLKLFERLAKLSPERYGAAHMLAMSASTQVYRSRVKQATALAHHQVATSTYLEMVNAGMEDAGSRLVDSLVTEGQTLAKMGRQREAVQYFTRALKYLTKISPDFDVRQLDLSIDLGEALLNAGSTRDKGIHLLNTMLHKATKLNASDQHKRIVDILLNAKSRRLDILGLWHKVFPR